MLLLSSCCGAGTAADTEMTTQIISSNLELHSLSTGRLPRVATANRMLKQMLFRYAPQTGSVYMIQYIFCTDMWMCCCVCLFRYQGYIGAALVLGGVDCNGPHLYSIYPHGSTDKLPYVTMGQSQTLTHHCFCMLLIFQLQLDVLMDFWRIKCLSSAFITVMSKYRLWPPCCYFGAPSLHFH